jgi:hypothetical protein
VQCGPAPAFVQQLKAIARWSIIHQQRKRDGFHCCSLCHSAAGLSRWGGPPGRPTLVFPSSLAVRFCHRSSSKTTCDYAESYPEENGVTNVRPSGDG